MRDVVEQHPFFVRFVELVAAQLDGPPSTTDDLARHLHVSTSQLHRLLGAVAGEPPAQFRRRILLERAAYALLGSDRSILDVAVDAGYASHEAFTRAFQRAYPTTPSGWRDKPGDPRIASANNVHFHPPAGLVLPTLERDRPMDLITIMTEQHVGVVAQMLNACRGLDTATLEQPITITNADTIDEDLTIHLLAARLVDELGIWNAAVANAPYRPHSCDRASIPELENLLDEHGGLFIRHVRDASAGAALGDTFVDATSGTPYFFTYAGMVAHVLTYGAHRRTLLAGALEAQGVALQEDPLSWPPLRPDGPTLPD